MTHTEFWVKVESEFSRDKKGQRYGQFLSNALDAVRPDLKTPDELDPFYSTDFLLIRAWKQWVTENW